MDERDKLIKVQMNAWRERLPVFGVSEDKPKEYDTAEIYDNPAAYMTLKGLFRYVDVDIIGVI